MLTDLRLIRLGDWPLCDSLFSSELIDGSVNSFAFVLRSFLTDTQLDMPLDGAKKKKARRGYELLFKFPPMIQGLDDGVTITVGPAEMAELCAKSTDGTLR